MRKIIPVVAAGATVLALAGGTFAYANLDKTVTLSVDGASRDVSTMSSTVADVLKSEKITLSDHDVVAPALGAKVTDGTRIAVQYGRQVRVSVDGKEQAYWTTATQVDQALAALNISANGAVLSTSRSAPIGREGLALNVATLKTLTVNAAGAKRQVTTTAQTVGDVLRAAKITVDANDLLSLQPSAKIANGMSFTFTRVDKAQVAKKEKVAYSTVRRQTKQLNKGVTKIDTSGKAGTRTLTYAVVRHNGKIVSTTKISSKITNQPRTQVILVGTKVRAPKSSGRSSSGGSSSGAPSVASGGVWDRIAACESGGNWSINTGNGFYGGLQFTLSTWHANGGSGMPNNASRSAQIAVAKRVQASQGWGAWPACTSKLGIR